MTQEYIIRGNTIERREIMASEVALLSEVLPLLTTYSPLELSPLPKGLVYIITEPPTAGQAIRVRLLVERPPGLQRILYKHGPARSTVQAESWRISIPYQFFYFTLEGSQMMTPTATNIIWSPRQWGLFWSKEPFRDLQQPVTNARMPNCWENGNICFGSTSVQANQSMGHFVDEAINTFWTSEFNHDLDYPWPYRTMQRWQDASEANPDVWQEWGFWPTERMTLEERLRRAHPDGQAWRMPVPSSVDAVPIPAIETLPSFHNVEEWAAGMTNAQRERILAVLQP